MTTRRPRPMWRLIELPTPWWWVCTGFAWLLVLGVPVLALNQLLGRPIV